LVHCRLNLKKRA